MMFKFISGFLVRSVVDDIGLAPKEELHRRRPSVLILDGPSHRAAANRLSGRNIQPESSQASPDGSLANPEESMHDY